ncbi:MAG: hypothetical protein KBD55_01025 [Candidatus Pacebacteria bacterium]|nr:hypothetical protein [Candidatus Paceibacterota bacterium]
MSRRNFILIVIILFTALAVFFAYLFMTRTTIDTSTTPEENLGFLSRINPFNTRPSSQTNSGDNNQPNEPVIEDETPIIPESNLKQISSMPIAGYSIFQKEILLETPTLETNTTEVAPVKTSKKVTPPKTEFVPMVRYVAKEDGNIFQSFLKNVEERRFSNTVIPKIYEAFFGNSGQTVLMRYLKSDDKTIETFVGNLPKEILGQEPVQNNEVKGTFLPENITSMSLSQDSSKLFYLFNVGEAGIGINYDLVSKKTQILNSPFTEWLSQYPNSKMISLTTKPSGLVQGYMYKLDIGTKSLNRVLGGINGLTTLTSPNGKLIIFADANLSLNLYSIETGETKSLGLRTIPDKCVWGKNSDMVYCATPVSIPQATYPDSWYMGETSFRDQIWRIDISTINTVLISSLSDATDAINLSLDQNEDYLLFINKNNSFLWELSLK